MFLSSPLLIPHLPRHGKHALFRLGGIIKIEKELRQRAEVREKDDHLFVVVPFLRRTGGHHEEEQAAERDGNCSFPGFRL